jgi:uncharacterized membrane protein
MIKKLAVVSSIPLLLICSAVDVYAIIFDSGTISSFAGSYLNYRVNIAALQKWAGLGAVAIFVAVPFGMHKMFNALSKIPLLSASSGGGTALMVSTAVFVRLAAYCAVVLLAVQIWPVISPGLKDVINTIEGAL